MPVQHSSGAIIFRKDQGKVFYLLLNYHPEYWGLAKGAAEKGETIEDTARREIQEETGLVDITFIEGFKVEESYFFTSQGQRVFKMVTFLLARTKTEEIKISWEHIGYAWLPYKEALEKITYPSEKKFLQKAHRFISRKRI